MSAQKNPTVWRINPAAFANVWTYNQAAITYNQASLTYNGIVVGQSFGTVKAPAVWSKL